MTDATNIRRWGAKSTLSLLDQALTSASSLGVNILSARWMSGNDYGAFAVAFAAYLFLTTFHNAMLLEPLSVIGPARHAERLQSYFRAQLHVHGILVWPLTVASLGAAFLLLRRDAQSPLVGALVGGGLALPVLLLLWLARRMCYVLQHPATAVMGSGLYCLTSLATIFALRAAHLVTPASTFLAMALGSVFGACLIFKQASLWKRENQTAADLTWSSVLGENWRYGRWLVGSALLYSVAISSQPFFLAGAVGLGAAGILRAMQVPSLVMTQTIAAIGLLVLPALSYEFGKGQRKRMLRKAIVASMMLGAGALCFAAVLAITREPVDRLLYGTKYPAFAAMIPLLALVPVANGAGTGFSMALRASQMPCCDLIANAFAALTAVLSTVWFVHRWGVFGAAASLVLSFGVMNAVTVLLFAMLNASKWKLPENQRMRPAPSIVMEDV